jgi:hypothetical protein
MENRRKKSNKAFIFFLFVIFAGVAYLLRGYYVDKLKLLVNRSGIASPQITLTVTEIKAAEILSDILKEEKSISNLSVLFQSGKIALCGDIKVKQVITDAVTANYPELSPVVQLFPETTSAAVWVSPYVDNGDLKLMPEGFAINGWQIPLGLLPASYKDAIGEMIIKATDINKLGLEFVDIKSQNGKLKVDAQ